MIPLYVKHSLAQLILSHRQWISCQANEFHQLTPKPRKSLRQSDLLLNDSAMVVTKCLLNETPCLPGKAWADMSSALHLSLLTTPYYAVLRYHRQGRIPHTHTFLAVCWSHSNYALIKACPDSPGLTGSSLSELQRAAETCVLHSQKENLNETSVNSEFAAVTFRETESVCVYVFCICFSVCVYYIFSL